MNVIPAIDLLNGQAVRLRQGDYGQVSAYSNDPLTVATEWKRQGASLLHLVDLDGAREGKVVHLGLIGDIVKETGLPVQLGGGLRSYEQVFEVLAAGVSRVILGTVAVKEPKLLQRLIQAYPGRIVVGLDAKAGKIATDGWLQDSEVSLEEKASSLRDLGLSEVVYTDISRDGMLTGPDLSGVELLLGLGLRVTVAGGVSSLDDLRSLLPLASRGLQGVIIGKALYSGQLTLAEALAVSQEKEGRKQC